MQILIVYGTTEGQTQKIAGFIAERLVGHHHQVINVHAYDGTRLPDPGGFDAVIVAASVHAGHYQSAVVRFVQQHRAAIAATRNLLLSVSLAAASTDAEDAAGLQRCLEEFAKQTGWRPQQVHHVAGAFRYTVYDFFKRWAMKYIARRKGAPTDTSRDYELTDWQELARFVDAQFPPAPT